MAKKNELKKGDTVKTVYGTIETVLAVRGCQVFTEGTPNGWYHPTKVWRIRAAVEKI